MEAWGYMALAAMGSTLGLVGAGGSILTIPILVYLLNVPMLLATRYSLFMVGSMAFVATLRHRHHIFFNKALVLLIPSILGVFSARRFIIPNLVSFLGSFFMDKALALLLLIFMGFSGYFMVKNSPLNEKNHLFKKQNIPLFFIGLVLGMTMGLLGAGGGFLIIPTLIFLMGLNMAEAIPTSLFIITVTSWIGFASDTHLFLAEDWLNLAQYLAAAFSGLLLGLSMAQFIKEENLKKIFGYFLWGIGTTLLIKEFVL